ncbi:MAG: RES family NAD+ phosphorylase [Hyphomicrobiales bacterium]|nr:RES family NAD+ phosphorylase [Hyphomicrobiales bacterium]
MSLDPASIPTTHVEWPGAVRIIRSLFPPIDLFEDIVDPADWPLLISAEMKTNPRLMESIGALDLVPPERRVSGPCASWLMAPFTHVSTDRPGRFSDGTFGVLYAARAFETAVFETTHHHARFMAATEEAPGWTSQFREIVLDIDATLHDVRGEDRATSPLRDPDDYTAPQALGRDLRASGSDGIVYPSVRHDGGECAGLFWPDVASKPHQSRHLDYHWDGSQVNLIRDLANGTVWRVER